MAKHFLLLGKTVYSTVLYDVFLFYNLFDCMMYSCMSVPGLRHKSQSSVSLKCPPDLFRKTRESCRWMMQQEPGISNFITAIPPPPLFLPLRQNQSNFLTSWNLRGLAVEIETICIWATRHLVYEHYLILRNLPNAYITLYLEIVAVWSVYICRSIVCA